MIYVDGSALSLMLLIQAAAVSSPIALKHTHICSGSAASVTTKSPPTKKALVDVIVKQEPFSPDHDGLHKALKMGRAADLDTSQCKSLLIITLPP